jgi:hypothetical protein
VPAMQHLVEAHYKRTELSRQLAAAHTAELDDLRHQLVQVANGESSLFMRKWPTTGVSLDHASSRHLGVGV